MKILMIAPTPYFSDRGCHVRIYEEAEALKRAGHEVVITTYHLGRDLGDFKILRTPKIPWYKKTAAGASWHKFYLDFFLLLLTAKTLITFKPDIIHAHLHEGAFIAMILRRFFKRPIVFDYQGSLSSESVDHHFVKPNNPILKLAKFMEQKVNEGAEFVITSAPRNLKVAHLETVCDGVDTNILKPDLSRHKPQTFVYLGLLGEYQGTDLMLQAFAIVIEKFPQAQLIIGGFPKIEYYKDMSKKLGIGSQVEFVGAVDYSKIGDFLNRGQFAIAPKVSTTEANQKMLTYMACGLPVVAFNTEINAKMLGSTELLATLGDAESLASRMIFLLTQSLEQILFLGEANRVQAEEKFSWERTGEKILEVYKKAIEVFTQKKLAPKTVIQKFLGFLPKLLISGALLLWVFHKFDFKSALIAVKAANIWILLIILLLVVLKNVFSSLRWQVLLAARGPKVPFLILLKLYFIGVFFNNFMPSSVGGDIVKAYKLSKYTDQAFDSSISVVMERATGLFVLIFIGFTAQMFVYKLIGVAIFVGFLIACGIGLLIGDKVSKIHPKIRKLWLAFIFYKDRPKALAAAIGLSFLIQGLSMAFQYLTFSALGYHLPFWQAMVVFPVTNFVTFLSLLPNGWGAQEALYALLFGLIGINKTISVTVSLVGRLVTLLVALLGGLIYATEK
ncbi:MAG: flippase-like domain-containing protein [candidate division WWE3 bacterium]|nr:flippase-like domain-containing protein [candidate division WWE3 bacterium]